MKWFSLVMAAMFVWLVLAALLPPGEAGETSLVVGIIIVIIIVTVISWNLVTLFERRIKPSRTMTSLRKEATEQRPPMPTPAETLPATANPSAIEKTDVLLQDLEKSNPYKSVMMMTGVQFEQHVAHYLQARGYKTEFTKSTGDFGVDIFATRDGIRHAVQVKRYKGPVSRSAVSDAVAGKIHYRCGGAMAVTNSTFTKSAREMARSTGCVLIEKVQ